MHTPTTRASKQGTPTSRASRACNHCARVRLRCDGQSPCARCTAKNIQCTYSGRSRNRIARIAELTQDESILDTIDCDTSPSADQSGGHAHSEPSQTQSPQTQSSLSQSGHDNLTVSPFHQDQSDQLPPPSSYTVLKSIPTDSTSSPVNQSVNMANPNLYQNTQRRRDQQRQLADSQHPHIGVSLTSFVPPMTEESRPAAGFCGQLPYSQDFSFDSNMVVTASNPSLPFDDLAFQWGQEFNFHDWMAFDHMMSFPGIIGEESDWIENAPLANQQATQHSMQPSIEDLKQHPEMGDPSQIAPTSNLHPAMSEPLHFPSNPRRERSPEGPLEMPMDQRSKGDRKRVHQWPVAWDPDGTESLIRFPDMSAVHVEILETEDFGHVQPLTQRTYSEIYGCMKRVGGDGCYFRPFINGNLPPRQALNCFIQLYFEYFHPIFPIIHKATFNPSDAAWRLVLAVATVGCRYSRAPYARHGADALQELLRRSMNEAVSLSEQ